MPISAEVDNAFVAEIEAEEDIPYRSPVRTKIVAEQLNTVLAVDSLVLVAIAAESDVAQEQATSEPLPVLADSDPDVMPALPEDWNGNGFIFAEPVSGDILHGTPEGDIFIVDGVDGVTANGYDGGDIFMFANASGTISAGAGGDIVDLVNFSGTVNLGAGEDADALLIWSAGPGQLTRVYNFHAGEDAFVSFVENTSAEDTSAGWTLSHDGAAFMVFAGVHDDILA